jgi:hypothetical protein
MLIPTFHFIDWVSDDITDVPDLIQLGASLASSAAPGGPASPGIPQIVAAPDGRILSPGPMELVQANMSLVTAPPGPFAIDLEMTTGIPGAVGVTVAFPTLTLVPNVSGQDVNVASIAAASRTVVKGSHGSLALRGLSVFGQSTDFVIHVGAVWLYTP